MVLMADELDMKLIIEGRIIKHYKLDSQADAAWQETL